MQLNSRQFVLSKRPVGLPTESSFTLEKVSLSTDLKDNELLLHGLYYSVDPYMRGRMNEGKSYVEPFALNKPIEGSVVARVKESKSKNIKKDDLVFGQLPWATDLVCSADSVHKISPSFDDISKYLGVLGMTGLTAYFGLTKIGKPKAGETVVISGAAGAVGVIVGQIAKIFGCKVIGIVGSDKKIEVLKNQFGFDEAVNYKDADALDKKIKLACPMGIDIYFDNVGGPISDAVLQYMNFQSRIVICGQISMYNSKDFTQGPRIQPLILTKSILMQGFIVGNFKHEFAEGTEAISNWIKDGKLKSLETVVDGFDHLPEALIGLFSGKNTGKMIVKADA